MNGLRVPWDDEGWGSDTSFLATIGGMALNKALSLMSDGLLRLLLLSAEEVFDLTPVGPF